MSVDTIRKKLQDYISVADDKKIEAMYTILESEIEGAYDHWKDKDFVAELEQRAADLEEGRVSAIPWQEAKARILASTNR